MPESIAYNVDCMEYMRTLPDKAFDLAVVDPPYGIGVHHNMGRRKGEKSSGYKPALWDKHPPEHTYFDELFRVSKNQIVWGGNYFAMPPTKSFIVWRKPNVSEELSFAMVEYAWTSYEKTSKEWIGVSNEKNRIHPTQKPVALYSWIFRNYARSGDRILDTHLGSGSSRIAAYNAGLDFVGCEIDKYYYEAQEKRFKEYTAQMRLGV